tara:strand:- start:4920 stop:6005 length:1086 start_codon:yes stop_codon:yes gene_type:complete
MNDSDNVFWMRRALKLATLGKGMTSPNPLVGAVLLNKKGELISEGFHQKAGMPHAEAMAFDNLERDPRGGTLYVNLEPCCHYGKTPPCVKKIIDLGIKTVYISIKDPDRRVSGKGIQILKEAGLDVKIGLCEMEAKEINKAFIYKNLKGKSYGTLKWAMSLDGRIGLKNGESKWITNSFSRSYVHNLRSSFDAIVIGGNTLRKDNPILTTRGLRESEPLRVVFTKSLDLPEKCNLWDCKLAKTLVVYDGSSADENLLKRIPDSVEVEKLPTSDPSLLSKLLSKKGFNNLLWECGPNLATAALQKLCIQEVITFIAPKILGGIDAMNPLSELNFTKMNQVISLETKDIKLFQDDIFVKTYVT